MYLIKRLSYAFRFSLSVICFSSAQVLFFSWLLATRPPLRDLVEGFGELLGAYIQPESCFDLLQGSCLTYIPLGTSLVTYIRQGGILLLNLFSFMTYTHLRDLLMYMASSGMYIRQGGILLLSLFLFFCDLHPFKGSCHVYGFISNVHPLKRNLVT